MNFVFSRKFFILLAIGFVPLSLSWNAPALRYAVLIYDIALVALALFDYFFSRKLPEEFTIVREFERRFAIGDKAQVKLRIVNGSTRDFHLKIKDEFPPELILSDTREAEFSIEAQTTVNFTYNLTPPKRGKYNFGVTAVRFLSRLGLVWCQTDLGKAEAVKVYPNMRRAREMALKALGAVSFLAVQRKAVRRGEGRDFESMRDYVRGDELRHISWTATGEAFPPDDAPVSNRARPDDFNRARCGTTDDRQNRRRNEIRHGDSRFTSANVGSGTRRRSLRIDGFRSQS
jgi:uncharacterized protein (DUF58 family)